MTSNSSHTVSPDHTPESDDHIEQAFKASYVAQRYLKDDHIAISSRNGVVTLSGTVANDSHRALARATVASLAGVVQVDTQLVTAAQVAADNADSWIGRKVKLTLLFHRNVNGLSTTITVNKGVVTLTGEASSAAQKDLTGEYAGDITGVESVHNEMTIADLPATAERTIGEKMDDASISALVMTTLWARRSTGSMKTIVETRNGEVTLTGIARNAAEKSLVSKLIGDLRGVTAVHNEMTVDALKSR